MSFSWQLVNPLNAIIFDCDGTLSEIEGIDELATLSGNGEEVKRLTAQAMDQLGMTPEIYQKRLALVKPTRIQVNAIAQQYWEQRIPDVQLVIQALASLKKTIYVVSAGLYPSVQPFAALLAIPKENVYAVAIEFDSKGYYQNYDHTSPLTYSDGKHKIVTELKKTHAELGYVGDGANDLAAYELVKRFVGFGGAFYREQMAAKCQFYIKSLNFAPLLPLFLTAAESETLLPQFKVVYEEGLKLITHGEVQI